MRAEGFSPDTTTIKPIKENLGHRDLKEFPSRVGDLGNRLLRRHSREYNL